MKIKLKIFFVLLMAGANVQLALAQRPVIRYDGFGGSSVIFKSLAQPNIKKLDPIYYHGVSDYNAICDNRGNIELISDGLSIRDANNKIIANGDSILAIAGTTRLQSEGEFINLGDKHYAFIYRFQGKYLDSATRKYLPNFVSKAVSSYPSGLYMSEIVFEQGLFKVKKKNILLDTNFYWQMDLSRINDSTYLILGVNYSVLSGVIVRNDCTYKLVNGIKIGNSPGIPDSIVNSKDYTIRNAPRFITLDHIGQRVAFNIFSFADKYIREPISGFISSQTVLSSEALYISTFDLKTLSLSTPGLLKLDNTILPDYYGANYTADLCFNTSNEYLFLRVNCPNKSTSIPTTKFIRVGLNTLFPFTDMKVIYEKAQEKKDSKNLRRMPRNMFIDPDGNIRLVSALLINSVYCDVFDKVTCSNGSDTFQTGDTLYTGNMNYYQYSFPRQLYDYIKLKYTVQSGCKNEVQFENYTDSACGINNYLFSLYHDSDKSINYTSNNKSPKFNLIKSGLYHFKVLGWNNTGYSEIFEDTFYFNNSGLQFGSNDSAIINYVTVHRNGELEIDFAPTKATTVNSLMLDGQFYQNISNNNLRFKSFEINKDIYNFTIQSKDVCGNTITSDQSNNILLTGSKSEQSGYINLNWNSYKYWKNGVKIYYIEKYNNQLGIYSIIDSSQKNDISFFDTSNKWGCSEFRIRAVNSNSNLSSYSNIICLYSSVDVYIPDAFTPNADGLNEYFQIYTNGFNQINFQIFNIWGQLIFESHDPNKFWDGTYMGKLVPAGTYIGIFNGKASGKHIQKKQSINLLR